MTQFGPIVTGPHVEMAVTETLKTWLSTYLAEVEDQAGFDRGYLGRPRSWATTIENDTWPAEQLPAILVISPGTDGEPVQDESGYSAWWNVSVAAIVQGPTEASVRRNAGFYAAAIRACLVQQKSLGDFAESVDWFGEGYEGASADGSNRNRAQGAGLVHVRVKVEGVTQIFGPTTPPANPLDPLPNLPTVGTTHLTVVSEPVDEEV